MTSRLGEKDADMCLDTIDGEAELCGSSVSTRSGTWRRSRARRGRSDGSADFFDIGDSCSESNGSEDSLAIDGQVVSDYLASLHKDETSWSTKLKESAASGSRGALTNPEDGIKKTPPKTQRAAQSQEPSWFDLTVSEPLQALQKAKTDWHPLVRREFELEMELARYRQLYRQLELEKQELASESAQAKAECQQLKEKDKASEETIAALREELRQLEATSAEVAMIQSSETQKHHEAARPTELTTVDQVAPSDTAPSSPQNSARAQATLSPMDLVMMSSLWDWSAHDLSLGHASAGC